MTAREFVKGIQRDIEENQKLEFSPINEYDIIERHVAARDSAIEAAAYERAAEHRFDQPNAVTDGCTCGVTWHWMETYRGKWKDHILTLRSRLSEASKQ